MRLLVLLPDAYGATGGLAKFNRDMLGAFEQDPVCTSVVALARHAPVESAPKSERIRYAFPGRSRVRYGFSVATAALTNRFDAVVCAHIHLVPLARVAATLQRVPLLLVVHGIEAWEPTGRGWVDRFAGTVDYLVSVSRTTASRFRRWSTVPSERVWVIPNCIDLEEYRPGPKSRALVERYGIHGRRVLLTVGRMASSERYKGFDEILEALPTALQKYPDLVHLVVGDGDDRARLEKKAAELGLTDHVVFTGYVAEEEKVDHYRLADVFALPGRGEGFGIVYLEAMACGIPTIASSADASGEAVRGGDLGFIVDPASVDELLGAIGRSLAIENRNPPPGLDFFSERRFTNRWTELLCTLQTASGDHGYARGSGATRRPEMSR